MYIPIKWILKDLNEAMRSKKTKEAIKRGGGRFRHRTVPAIYFFGNTNNSNLRRCLFA